MLILCLYRDAASWLGCMRAGGERGEDKRVMQETPCLSRRIGTVLD